MERDALHDCDHVEEAAVEEASDDDDRKHRCYSGDELPEQLHPQAGCVLDELHLVGGYTEAQLSPPKQEVGDPHAHEDHEGVLAKLVDDN